MQNVAGPQRNLGYLRRCSTPVCAGVLIGNMVDIANLCFSAGHAESLSKVWTTKSPCAPYPDTQTKKPQAFARGCPLQFAFERDITRPLPLRFPPSLVPGRVLAWPACRRRSFPNASAFPVRAYRGPEMSR